MKRSIYGFVLMGSVLLASSLFAATEDELRMMMTDARGASDFEDFENAIAFCDKAIEAKPDLAEAYALRSQAKAALKDMEGARSDAEKAIELAPLEKSTHQAYFVQAVVSFDNDSQPEKALESISKAIELTSSDPFLDYYELRAEIHKAMGNQALADADTAKFNELLDVVLGGVLKD